MTVETTLRDPQVPVMHRDALGYPEHVGRGEYDNAVYVPLSVALTSPIAFDAHFCAYSAPTVGRRLATEKAFAFRPTIVAFILDAEPAGHAPVTEEWIQDQWRRIQALLAVCPGGFVYRTRGGYRIVWLLPEPFVIDSRYAALKWRASYLNWISAIEQGVGIVGDATCADWTRLYRLPFVVRDGEAQTPNVFGDARNIGTWTVPMVEPPDVVATPTTDIISADLPDRAVRIRAAELLAGAWPDAQRHQATLALCGALARASWDEGDIADFVCAVAEGAHPGNGDRSKRLKQAQTSVRKIAEGALVAGWPTVCEHVDPEVVDEVTALLGLRQAPPQDDPVFVAAMVALIPVAPPPPRPDGLDIKAILKAAQKTLAGRKDAESLKYAELLKRVNAGDFLTEDADDNRLEALMQATLLVARIVPTSATHDQIVRVLLSSAGALGSELSEIVARAVEIAKTLPDPLLPKRRGPVGGGGGGGIGHISADDQFDVEMQGPRQGRPVNHAQKNVRIGLVKLGVQLQYNEFCEQEEMIRDGRRVVIEDSHLKGIRAEMERIHDLKPPKDDLWDLTEVFARENKYHPVRDYLDSRPTDQPITGITETWLIDFAGAPDTPYVRAVSRITLVAAVRRIRQPGCVFQEMLILETPVQGKNKSTALKALAVKDEWFSDDLELDDDDKKMIEQTSGKWIIEAPELSGLSKGSHNKMKKWMSKTSGRSRMAYGRKVREFLRQFIVIGTTNDTQYLKDVTGNRRFWPVRVVEFNVKALIAARDQLWTEASRLDLENPADEYIRLDPSLYEAAAEEQARRQVDDPLKMTLDGLFGQQTGRVRIEDVWKVLGHHTEDLPDKNKAQEITTAMTGLGWEKGRRQVTGVRDWYYERGTDEEKRVVVAVDGNSVTGWRIKALPMQLPAPPRPPPEETVAN